MAISPEKESILPSEEVVSSRPETLPEKVEKIAPGVQVVPTQFTKQVADDQGKPLITTPQTKKVVIELPKTQDVLVQESKGDSSDSKTWLAKFWLRMIEKAKFFGLQIVSLVSQRQTQKSNA